MSEQFTHHHVANGEGWELCLTRCVDPKSVDRGRRPLLIVPGYGMNSFIFGYHPKGLSMMESLARRGRQEVWTVDFRAQGESRPCDGASRDGRYRLEDIACNDLPATIDHILRVTDSRAEGIDLVGCSLGGTYVCMYLALMDHPRIGSVVAIGSPLRWVDRHPAMRLFALSPWLVGKIPTRGTRKLAAFALPLIAQYAPRLMSFYLHADHVDVSKHQELVRTVDDASPPMNRQLAAWLRDRDLTVRGVNITEAMGRVTTPLLVVLANGDGIVPEATALSSYTAWGGGVREVLHVGDDHTRFAHADLFISNYAHERVFAPIADWLRRQAA